MELLLQPVNLGFTLYKEYMYTAQYIAQILLHLVYFIAVYGVLFESEYYYIGQREIRHSNDVHVSVKLSQKLESHSDTVEPPITDSPRCGPPPCNGQTAWLQLTLP